MRSKEDKNVSKIESLESESPVVEWLMEHGKTILGVVAALLLLLFLLFRLYSQAEAKSEKDYIEATRLENKLFTPSEADAALQEMKQLIRAIPKSAPSTKASWRKPISIWETPMRQPHCSAVPIERIKSDELPLYIDSSRTALEITEGKLDSAYAKALRAKTRARPIRGRSITSTY